MFRELAWPPVRIHDGLNGAQWPVEHAFSTLYGRCGSAAAAVLTFGAALASRSYMDPYCPNVILFFRHHFWVDAWVAQVARLCTYHHGGSTPLSQLLEQVSERTDSVAAPRVACFHGNSVSCSSSRACFHGRFRWKQMGGLMCIFLCLTGLPDKMAVSKVSTFK